MDKVVNNKKYLMLVLLFLGWLIGNFDRLVISYSAIFIGKDFHLSASQIGAVFSCFFIGYALMQIPGGILGDKFNTKKVVMILIGIWSIFTIMTGLAWSLGALLVIRFVFGLAEGGFIPCSIKLISESFPAKEQGKAISVLMSSFSVAAMILPIFAISIMVNYGWRSMFYLLGVVGIVVAALYILILKKPATDGPETTIAAQAPVSQDTGLFKELLKHPMVWLLTVANFSLYIIQWGVNAWIPTYLATARHLNLQTLGWVATVPAVACLFSMYATGAIVDKLKKSGQERLIAAVALLASVVLLYLMYSVQTLFAYIICSTLLYVVLSPVGIIITSILVKSVPSKIAGKSMGLVNTGGQAAGIIVPIAIGFIIDANNGSFLGAFLFMIAFGVIGAISILAIRNNKSGMNIATETNKAS